MDISFMELLILALASFRLTRLIVYDKITERIRSPFFQEIEEENDVGEKEIYLIPKKEGVRGFIGALLSCYWCTGMWTSIFLCAAYLFYFSAAVPIILILAVAGLAAIMETILQRFLDD